MSISDWSSDVCSSDLVCNGGAWVWDDSPAAALYEQNHKGLEIPDVAELDLRDVHLPNGNHIEVLEPLMSYRIRYQDPGRFEADLRFDGIMAPNSHPIGCAPLWRGPPLPQPMPVTATTVLDGSAQSADPRPVPARS